MARSRHDDKAEIAAKGLVVSDRLRLAKALAQSLRHGAGLKHCQQIEGNRPGGTYFEFTEAGAHIPVAGRKVFELFHGSLQTYWLGLKVDFVYETKLGDLLTHASFALFCGSSPQSAVPLFRAEWDPRAKSSSHAQPHWNLQGEILRRDLASPTRFSPDEFQRPRWQLADENVNPTIDKSHSNSLDWICNFHFAMSATWHENKGRHSPCEATEELLQCWVRGCVEYIRAQLVTVDGMVAAKPTALTY